MSATKYCPHCKRQLDNDAFFPEPNDYITGLSMLCKECLMEGKKKKRTFKGFYTMSPGGLKGTVKGIRTDTKEIVIHFEGTRTAVLPMEEVDED